MSAAKKSSRPKKKSSSKNVEQTAPVSPQRSGRKSIKTPFKAVARWVRSLQYRSPHRSFRRTYRRDYARPLALPGYLAFTAEVWKMLWRHKTTFGLLAATYAVISGLVIGLASQAVYTQMGELLRTTGGEIFNGNLGRLGEAGLLLVAGLSGGLSPDISPVQQVLAGFLILMAWLTTVWLLRAFFAGRQPSLRDALYNSGAPIIPTFLVGIVLLIQLIPVALVPIGIAAAVAAPTGILEGAGAMMFWLVIILLILLSLYWITSTMIALVVVTLPGMYPVQALKTASELVVGRRSQILKRIVWLIAVSALVFIFVMVYIIMVDTWLKGLVPSIEWLPIVPVSLSVIGSISVVWTASYVYMLYRKVVDDSVEPV